MRQLPLFVAIVALFVAQPLLACSCAPPPPPKEALTASTAVFTGKVVAVDKAGDFQIAVTIEISGAYKGVKEKKVTVYTADNGASCGVGFTKGTSYLVYAREQMRGEEKVLGTNLCSRTTTLANAKDDLAELGEAPKVK
jgi:hypothetical protein